VRHGVARIKYEMKNELTHLVPVGVHQTASGRQQGKIKGNVLSQQVPQFLAHSYHKPAQIEDNQVDLRLLADRKNPPGSRRSTSRLGKA
jgi:hypothetical protein